jgi:hypothetical protein
MIADPGLERRRGVRPEASRKSLTGSEVMRLRRAAAAIYGEELSTDAPRRPGGWRSLRRRIENDHITDCLATTRQER